ncbi:MAG: 30S ribosomal protein S13 [Thermoprotei archaeon]
MSESKFRHIVRIAGVDVEGDLLIPYGLAKIKGLGYHTGLAIARIVGLDPQSRIGYLSDAEVQKIEDVVSNPLKYGIPVWYLNRRKDYTSGEDRHLISADLIFEARSDIEREIKTRSWRGIRHQLGLKVRGQRTHTTGRIGPVVGVTKSKATQEKQK